MVKKKKGKNRVNAIDKYLQQKKYRETQIKHKQIILKDPKVVIPKIKSERLLELIRNSELAQNSSRNKEKTSVVSTTSLSVKSSRERKGRRKTDTRNQDANTNGKQIKRKQIEKTKWEKNGRKLTEAVILTGNVTKPQCSSKRSSNHLNSDVEVKGGARKWKRGKLEKEKSAGNQNIEKLLTAESSHVFPQQPKCCECIADDSNMDKEVEIVEEKTPIMKKYQPYMDRIRLLTPDAIAKFIKDNRDYYVKFRKEAELKNLIGTKNSKENKDDTKDMFKCNPFNSEQQIAMYLALREIFNVSASEFQECRIFFTVLLPEISCQLFAETFRIQPSFALRLIKRLYPNPTCLV